MSEAPPDSAFCRCCRECQQVPCHSATVGAMCLAFCDCPDDEYDCRNPDDTRDGDE